MLVFHEWLKLREVATADMRTDIGKGYKFNIGDWIYFGIHELAREVKDRGDLPRWEPADLIHAMRPVVDVEPQGAPDGGELVWVRSDKTPNQLGYRKITNKNGAKVRKNKDGTFNIGIPAEWIEDVTSVFSTGAQLHAQTERQKLGLVYDRGIPSQSRLIRMIKMVRDRRPEMPPDDTDAVNALKAQWGLPTSNIGATKTPGQAQLPITPMPQSDPWAQLGLPPDEPPPKPKPLGGAIDQLRAKRAAQQSWQSMTDPKVLPMNPFRDTASYDPSIAHYNPYWKSHDDTKRYNYIIG